MPLLIGTEKQEVESATTGWVEKPLDVEGCVQSLERW
jgi:hypothetical protein